MLDFLIEFKVAITLIVLGIFIHFFRKEFNKLLAWIVNFKRLSKTKDGYSASAASESAGMEEVPLLSNEKQSAIEEIKESGHESDKPETDWLTLLSDKDYPRACEIVRDMITQEENPEKKTQNRARLGHAMFEQNKQKGIEYFDELIKAGDDAVIVYEWYGLSFFWSGDYPKAVDVMLAGIKRHPESPKLPDLLASTLQKQGKHIQAVEILQRNIDQNLTYAQSYITLKQILVDIDMPEQAINCCKIGMQQCPQNVFLIEEYVKILPELGAPKERMFAYLRLCEINPDNSSYWTMLGNEYLDLSFHDLAIEAYHKGNTLAEEKEAWILANIGNIMNKQGFYSRGVEFLHQAISIDPSSQYAHERLGNGLKLASDQQAERDEIRNEVGKSFQYEGTLDSLLKQVQGKLSQKADVREALKTATIE